MMYVSLNKIINKSFNIWSLIADILANENKTVHMFTQN